MDTQPTLPDTVETPAYSQNQRERTLTLLLVAIMLATTLFGVLNLFYYAESQAAIIFFLTAVLCLPALWLNRRGYQRAAGIIAVVTILIAAHFNLVDGAGIRDPGVVAYPIIIIIGGLLFGKRAVPLFTIMGIGSLITVVYAQASFDADSARLLIISTLILVAAGTTWAIMDNMDKHIARLKESEIELRQAYEQTQAQAQQVHQIIETVPEGVLLLDAKRRMMLANRSAQEILNILAPFHDQDTPLNQIGDTSLTAILDAVGNGGWQELKASGSDSIFEVTAHPVQNAPASYQDWVIVLRDVTLKRKQQDVLREQERLATVGQLASGIAHDFRNILTVISTYSQILLNKPDTPKRDKYLAVIQDQTQDAAQLIEQILDFGRRSVMERKVTDLVDLIEDLVSLLKRTMPSNIVIQFEHDPGSYHFNADKARLQQAFMNLAVNARDAMPDGGRLKFMVMAERPSTEVLSALKTEREAWLHLQVSDTGNGIEADDLPHIFEPFYTKKEAGKGTGLGLAQVYGIVKQHEGIITVESLVGQGTTFDLYFPAIIEEPVLQTSQS
ncbi:MAG: hypothetical protein H6662_04820 [Ardenticatenaceae bacterium]|nr:hypothetical protein [Anaerolineales bacterium]MCB8920888.1 hypothetical protein [Ardenticatenaceae bacterium]